jgi:hypothetical protein
MFLLFDTFFGDRRHDLEAAGDAVDSDSKVEGSTDG